MSVPAGKFLTQRRLCACADSGGVVESFCLTFTAGLPGIGEPMSAALCEDGDDVAVTADNRREYVEAYVDCILSSSVEKQVWPAPGTPIYLNKVTGMPHSRSSAGPHCRAWRLGRSGEALQEASMTCFARSFAWSARREVSLNGSRIGAQELVQMRSLRRLRGGS